MLCYYSLGALVGVVVFLAPNLLLPERLWCGTDQSWIWSSSGMPCRHSRDD